MKLTTSSILQILTWIAGAGSSLEIPVKWKPYVLAVSGIASVLLHAYAGVHDEQGNKSPATIVSTVTETVSGK